MCRFLCSDTECICTTVCKKNELSPNYCSFHWIDWWLKTNKPNTKCRRKSLVVVSIPKEARLSSSLFKLKWQQKTLADLVLSILFLVTGRSNEKNISRKNKKSVKFINNGSTVDNFSFVVRKKKFKAVEPLFMNKTLVEAIC